ncbi:CcmD family protein [Radiobacillus sp. PE A8.2]
MTYLFVGVLILWAGILTYMGRLFSQQKKVSRQLENLKQ